METVDKDVTAYITLAASLRPHKAHVPLPGGRENDPLLS